MKKLYYLFFILFAIPSFGQINYEAGYIINNEGIKTECLIRNVAWQDNPTAIEYRLSETDKKTITTNIADIKEFGIGGIYKYKRFTTKIDQSNSEILALSSEKNPIWKDETVLLKVLVEGEANLYQYNGSGNQRYFISTGNHQKAEQLIYKEYYAQNNAITENNAFRQQLFTTLKSDKLTVDDFKNLPFEKKKIIDLFIKYNTAKNKQITNFEPKQNKGIINFKAQLGVDYTSLFYVNSIQYLTSQENYSANFPKKPILSIGAEMEYILPFNQKKWGLLFEANYQSYHSDAITSDNYPISIDYKYINLIFGLRHYLFLNTHSSLFVNAGLAYGVPFNSFSIRQFPKKSWETEPTTYIEAIGGNGNGFLGLGYSFEKYNIELRYNTPRELFIKESNNIHTDYHSVGIIIGYKFL
jgi:hypothetical protein